MNLANFLRNFPLYASAPNAAVKLRELILTFAVQGKLVRQCRKDTPVDSARGHLEQDVPGVLSLPSIPNGWRWAPISSLCDMQTGKRMKGGALASGVISLGGEHIKPDGTVDYTVPRHISPEFYAAMKTGRVALHDTLMVKDGATTGKTAFVRHLPASGKAAVNEHVFILRWNKLVNKRFAFYCLRAFALSHIASKSSGIIGGVRRKDVSDFPLPLPPLAEQKRIVAKADKLMALADEWEAQLARSRIVAESLMNAAIADITGRD